MQTLAAELARLAHATAGSPDAREQLASALMNALTIIDPTGPSRTRELAALAVQFDDLAGGLIILADRAEWLAERARSLTTQSPQAGIQTAR